MCELETATPYPPDGDVAMSRSGFPDDEYTTSEDVLVSLTILPTNPVVDPQIRTSVELLDVNAAAVTAICSGNSNPEAAAFIVAIVVDDDLYQVVP